MQIKIKENSQLFYSSVMLAKMNSLIDKFHNENGFSVKRDIETPFRVGRTASLRERYGMTEEQYLQKESYYLEGLKTTTVDLRGIDYSDRESEY